MKLTGKCKEDFEKWFADEIERTEKKLTKQGRVLVVEDFHTRITQSMQYGVYVDFAEKYAEDNNQVNHILKLQRIYYVDMNFGLKESRLESVSNFNLIYNDK